VHAECRGDRGVYCLDIPVDDDMAVDEIRQARSFKRDAQTYLPETRDLARSAHRKEVWKVAKKFGEGARAGACLQSHQEWLVDQGHVGRMDTGAVGDPSAKHF